MTFMTDFAKFLFPYCLADYRSSVPGSQTVERGGEKRDRRGLLHAGLWPLPLCGKLSTIFTAAVVINADIADVIQPDDFVTRPRDVFPADILLLRAADLFFHLLLHHPEEQSCTSSRLE